MLFNHNQFSDSYNAKSLVLLDLSNDKDFISKNVEDKQLPASLAKLFVIEYASTFTDLDDIVSVNSTSLSLTKQGSSVANIKEKEYYLQNLFAAMLVPSGNDAAYAVADYCGSILSKESKTTKERINIFLDSTSEYYNENVLGVKTGSLSDDYNLIVLYKKHGKEFLICSLGSQSNTSRYDDVSYI